MFVIEAPNFPPCSLFTIEKEWVETEFTWNNAKADLPWENIDAASGLLGGGDYSIDPVAFTNCMGLNEWMSFDITELVRSIIKGNPINGLLLKEVLNGTDNDFSEGCTIASSEADEVENRPKIVIDYGNTDISDTFKNNKSIYKIKENPNSIIIQNSKNNKIKISIYSVSGKINKTLFASTDLILINKSDFSKGTYFIKFDGKKNGVSKIIIN